MSLNILLNAIVLLEYLDLFYEIQIKVVKILSHAPKLFL